MRSNGPPLVAVGALALSLTLPGCGAEKAPEPSPASEHEVAAEPADHDDPAAGGHAHGAGEPAAVPAGFEGPGKLELPEDLRALLVAEMLQIEQAMHRILSALSRGELGKVAEDAQAVHDSFILAQKLTPEQAGKLGELLPPELVSMDRQFHQQAAELAAAAKAGHADHAAEIYSRMTTGCVGCHRAYARERFPGLAPTAGH